jgi:hypothetical protein
MSGRDMVEYVLLTLVPARNPVEVVRPDMFIPAKIKIWLLVENCAIFGLYLT